MGAIIGLVLGIVATVLVSRYYFLRTVDKRLSVFGLLNSYVFAGIAPDVRRNLHFIFQDQEVTDLQQVVLLVANDGERAISNIIEPLSVHLPSGIDVLDVSILHRNPDVLKAAISQRTSSSGQIVDFSFPLLNKGEFFVVKLLLSGSVAMRDMAFRILADDLPRSIKVRHLPPASLRDKKYEIEWPLVGIGCAILLFPLWVVYMLHLLWTKQPELFPYPWEQFVISWQSGLLVLPGIILLLFYGFLGAAIALSAFFDGEFPPKRSPKFPIPKELRNIAFPYRFSLHESFDESILIKEPAPQKSDA